MLSLNDKILHDIGDMFKLLLEGHLPDRLEIPETDRSPEIAELTLQVNRFLVEYGAFAAFLQAISRGNLDSDPPKGKIHMLQSLKNLHANLRHLTWKTQQIARGNFKQRVDFMGEFSESFNSMVAQLSAARDELLHTNEELDKVSRTDPLTNLINRRGAQDVIKKETARAMRSHTPFAILSADIDHFKQLNDTYGHDAGDAVLVAVAKAFVTHVRCEDMCARWGGEEFLILLTDATPTGVFTVSERLRTIVEHITIQHQGQTLKTTISAGMSLYQSGEDIEACIKRSDMCLYKAKQNGRNQVWYQESEGTPAQRVRIQFV